MQIHSLGHASLFVNTDDCKILIDPVLEDPFFVGLNESCPKREIAKEKLPEYDFLIISHSCRVHNFYGKTLVVFYNQ